MLASALGHGRGKLTSILQSEASECGLACLAMISCFHGHRVDLNTLRRELQLSGRGADLGALMRGASALHLVPRAVRAELDGLPALFAPAILHWGMNHFVVLRKTTRRGVWVHDPAVGPRHFTWEEANTRFTGIALELRPSQEFKRQDRRKRLELSDLWSHSRGLVRSLVHLLLLSLLLQLTVLAAPLYVQLVVDDVLLKNDADLLAVVAVGFGLLAMLRVVTEWLRSLLSLHTGVSVGYQLAVNIFRHLLRLPVTYFERRHVGDVTSRFGATRDLRYLLTDAVISAGLDGLMGVVTLVMMYIYSPLLASVVAGAVCVYALARVVRVRFETEIEQARLVAEAREHSTFVETIRSMLSIKSFGREQQRGSLWQNDYADAVGAQTRKARFEIVVNTLNNVITGATRIVVIYLGAAAVIDGRMTTGMLLAFLAYNQQFAQAAVSFINTVFQFRLASVQLERLADIAFTAPEAEPGGASKFRVPVTGKLALAGVSFRHGTGEPWVLRNANLTLEAGQCAVLVGRSGSGKSTTLKLLLGLLPPSEGEVRIDDRPLADLGLDSLRSQVAAVTQGDTLLEGSVAQNVSFFDTALDMPRVIEACRAARVHDEIMAMPMKYETRVGDLGASMSQGQRQRMLLARALYARPRVLFLDEATSHVDLDSEAEIMRAVKGLGISVLVISHRPEVWRIADRVFMLQDRTIVERQPAPRPSIRVGQATIAGLGDKR